MEKMEKTFYELGKRDALAEIFMMLRLNELNYEKTFYELVNQYKKIDKQNPHCIWIENNLNK